MKLFEYLNRMNEMNNQGRIDFLDHLEMRNLCSAELTENDMWILTHSASNNEYLQSKLSEEELSVETEAPDETVVPAVPFDPPSATPTTTQTPTDDDKDKDDEDEDEDEDDKEEEEEEEEDDDKIETSKEGIGVLALLGEIQEKLAAGKPSPVEIAAIKALRKLVS